MRESSRTIGLMDMGHIIIKMGQSISDHGKMTSRMDSEEKSGMMAHIMKVISNQDVNMVKVHINGQMVVYMMEYG